MRPGSEDAEGVFGLGKIGHFSQICLSWIMMSPSREGEAAPDPGFYDRLGQHLTKIAFDQRVSDLCEPLYWTTYLDTGLRIHPVVYFKMLMIGFLENLRSERAIAARCSDSLSVRALLGYGSKEVTPGEPELGAIRHRLEPQMYEEVLDIMLLALKSHGLSRRRNDCSRHNRGKRKFARSDQPEYRIRVPKLFQ